MARLIRKGAEANLYLDRLLGREVIVKDRIRKLYRVDFLDHKIRSYRTVHEAQMIHDAKKSGVPCPAIYFVDESGCRIFMEYLEGPRVKERLAESSPKDRISICHLIGKMVGKLHKNQIIHGDVTTSNLILTDHGEVSFIDFGLSFQSNQLEDRGVDIHLAKRALNSTHFDYAEPCFKALVEGYGSAIGFQTAKDVLDRAGQIERRGRYFAERQT